MKKSRAKSPFLRDRENPALGRENVRIHDMLLFSSLGVSDQVRHKPSCTRKKMDRGLKFRKQRIMFYLCSKKFKQRSWSAVQLPCSWSAPLFSHICRNQFFSWWGSYQSLAPAHPLVWKPQSKSFLWNGKKVILSCVMRKLAFCICVGKHFFRHRLAVQYVAQLISAFVFST